MKINKKLLTDYYFIGSIIVFCIGLIVGGYLKIFGIIFGLIILSIPLTILYKKFKIYLNKKEVKE